MARGKGRGGGKPSGQKKPPLTHFLCLPLVTPESKPQLEASLEQFSNDVAIKEPAGGVETNEESQTTTSSVASYVRPKAIRPVGALHCTLGVMSLDKDKLADAVETLKSLDIKEMIKLATSEPSNYSKASQEQAQQEQATDAPASLERPVSPPAMNRSMEPIRVTLKGLVSMHAPHKTSILYSAPHDTSERLYPFCVAVQKLFADKDLLLPDDRKLKLHATIVNTIYAKGGKKPAMPKWKADRIRQAKGGMPEPEPDQATDKAAGKGTVRGQHSEEDGGQADNGKGNDSSGGHGPNANAPLKIDATAILEKFKDFVWAENFVLDRVAICEMGAKKITDANERQRFEFQRRPHPRLTLTDFTKIFRRTTYPTISPTAASQNQAGRTVLITGGSDGIGYGIAKAFSQARAAKIILVSRSQSKLDKAVEQLRAGYSNTTFEAIAGDSSDPVAIQSLWTKLADEKTFIDILVLNAADLSAGVEPMEAIASFHFNVTANLHMLDHFLKQANPDSRPRILLSISSAAVQCYNFPLPGYAGSKAGFANYLCHLAEFKPETELRLINFHPGAVYTSAAGTNREFTGEEPIWDDPSLSAHTAVWCCGKDAGFLHGRFVWANWNVDELLSMKEKILANPGFLKIGVAGVDNFTVMDLLAKCQAVPVPKP